MLTPEQEKNLISLQQKVDEMKKKEIEKEKSELAKIEGEKKDKIKAEQDKISKSKIDELKNKLEKVETRYRELITKDRLEGPEKLELIPLGEKLKSLREQVKFAEQNPKTFEAQNIHLKPDDQVKYFIDTLNSEYSEMTEKVQTAFYPSLKNEDGAGHELMRQQADKFLSSVDKNGLTGINQFFDEIEKSAEIGRTDFVSLSIEGLQKYFDNNQIRQGQPYNRFYQIKSDFLSKSNRGELKSQISDLKSAKSIVSNITFIEKT